MFKNEASEQGGLVYGNETLVDLVNKDTDGDGVLDWEENLWGTDPTKKDTDGNGVNDGVELARMKSEGGGSRGADSSESLSPSLEDEENLTETDKFSREFFATIATLSQSGEMDQAAVDELTNSLAEHIKNSPPRKVFLISELKIINDDSVSSVQKYNNAMDSIKNKYPVEGNALNVLQRFVVDEESVDVTVLLELDPIIEQTHKIINELINISVPQSLSVLHLDFVNSIQRLVENLNDVKLYDTDVIVALSAISQYEPNTIQLESATRNLGNAINQKLSN